MPESTRRTFLSASAAGAAVAGAVTLAPAALVRNPLDGHNPLQPQAPVRTGGPLVAYVEDVSAGDVTLLVGEEEVVVHDPDLATAIARAASRT